MSHRIRVAVLFGGRSAEHEVSVRSARTIVASLDPERFEPVPVAIDRTGRWHLDPEARLLGGPGDAPRLSAANGASEIGRAHV